MELRQLRYLVALADERHFTRAAEREHVAQPALSQQIRRLEAEVGLPLVERTTRRVALTDAGQALVTRARRALAELEAADAEIASLAGVRAGRVRVGAVSTLGPVDLSRLLATFGAQHPGVDLTVREGTSDEVAAMVRRDEVDCAFLSVTERIESEELELLRLADEEIVVVLPPDHPLATRDAVRIRDLRAAPFVAFREGSRLREVLIAAARDAGFEPRIVLGSNDIQRIRDLVSHALGVAILPRTDAERAGPEVAVAELVEPALTRDVTLAWRAGRRLSPAAAAFLALARAG